MLDSEKEKSKITYLSGMANAPSLPDPHLTACCIEETSDQVHIAQKDAGSYKTINDDQAEKKAEGEATAAAAAKNKAEDETSGR